ncbi:MAG: hypothetical protein ACR2MQ_06855 [Gemmatimonadaceae bacterium]
MAASDEKYMAPVSYPTAPSYSRNSGLNPSSGAVTKQEKRLGEHYRYKAGKAEATRRLALQTSEAMEDVTYRVMDSNERMMHEAVEVAKRPMGEIARENVVRYNARAIGRHEKNLDLLQELVERTMVENATTDLEPAPEPEPQQRGFWARLLNG